MVVSGTIAPPRDIPDLTAEETIRIILSNMNLVVPVICAIVVIIIAIVVICILRSKGNHHKGTLLNRLTNCSIFFLLFFFFFTSSLYLCVHLITLRYRLFVAYYLLHYFDINKYFGNNRTQNYVWTKKQKKKKRTQSHICSTHTLFNRRNEWKKIVDTLNLACKKLHWNRHSTVFTDSTVMDIQFTCHLG